MTTRLPAPTPVITPESRPFWDTAAQGALLLKRCTSCAEVIWYPRDGCPVCWGRDTVWFTASGRGVVHSYTVNHRGEGAYAGHSPYVLAYVELEEGPRLLTNIVGVDDVALDIDALVVGGPVEAVFTPTDDGMTALPRFRQSRPTPT